MKIQSRSILVSLLIMFFVLPGVLACLPRQALAFAGGSGTSGDPYQITTPAELASLSSYLGAGNSGKYFKVMNNIDLNVSPYNTGTGWTPIGTNGNNFYGHFDGNFKTISNLYFNSSGTSYAGLFGETASGSIVQNVLLSNANVTGGLEVGALVGFSNGTLTKDGVTGGTVSGTQRVGGLVGSDYGTMTYDYSSNTVDFNPGSSATCCSGGLAGEAYNSGTISNSYSRSNIVIANGSGDQGGVGGVYGNDYSSGTKTDLYSTGSITMVSGSFPAAVGGLAGENYTSTTASYWDKTTSGWSTSGGGAGVTGELTSAMKNQNTYSGWDFSATWGIDTNGVINNGYPYLLWQSTDQAPNAPSSLGGSSVINGSASGTTQPAFSFSLSDPDSGDTVKYEIQIANNSSFTSPTVDYTSVLAAQGSASFTVGQAAGSGSYTTGSSGQTLADASYYWRVKAIDNSGSASSYTSANSGSVAFIVDTTGPTTPGTPTTTTPTSYNRPTWTWTASTDSGAGLAATPYTVYWSQDNTFATGVTSSTSSTNSFTQPSGLADGTWYFRIRAADSLGNNSSYSSAGSVLIDTVSPTTAGTPTGTSPTSNTSPTWTWTASTDVGGSGIASYVVEWSQDVNFVLGNSITVISTNSFSYALSEGTWYMRVRSSDNAANLSAWSATGSIVVDLTAPSTPGTPSTASPNNSLPTWTWTASTDSGGGLAATPYTIYWSQSPTFSFGVSVATSTTNSYTPSTPLADGTWYVKVFASDAAGNNSGFSTAGSVLVDATPPSVPGIPSTASAATNSTPVWTWTAATDSGSGLAATPYTVEWSQDPTFASGVSSSTSTTTSFTQPLSLVNGTWYFRVRAQDAVGNASAYSTAGSITISIVVPATPAVSIPGVPDISVVTLDNTTPAASSSPDTSSGGNSLPLVLLNSFSSYTSGVGKQLNLGSNQIVQFKVDTETHSAVVQAVGSDYAILVLHSTPMMAYLSVGQTKQYDVNHDGINDISITLSGITNGVAQLVFAQIKQPTVAAVIQAPKAPRFGFSQVMLLVSALSLGAAVIILLKRRKAS